MSESAGGPSVDSRPEGALAPRVAVLDYGSGNLRSAVRALVRAGAEVELTSDPERARRAEALVVPGVGAYAACMAGLRGVDGITLVRDWVASQRPLLGICVGFQVLFEAGTEHGETTEGIGVLTGGVGRLDARRLPHMGWNTVTPHDGRPAAAARVSGPRAEGLDRHDATAVLLDRRDGERFYFVHSYGVTATTPIALASNPAAPVSRLLSTHEGHTFVAAVSAGPVLATQFHPEKSADAGAGLLRGWVSGIRNG